MPQCRICGRWAGNGAPICIRCIHITKEERIAKLEARYNRGERPPYYRWWVKGEVEE